ncbi:hypothetical protein [Burkholderia sp. BCC1972]|uniref:hypothetical protein n=1 Tax=Burkholderia sp. BCC1972 TaxID=2817438 RepID=UPI002ABE6A29|nr:hypothetical protein [Burkholderia sp. BCC1972]
MDFAEMPAQISHEARNEIEAVPPMYSGNRATDIVITSAAVAERKTTNTMIGVGIGTFASALLSHGNP